jgi:type VI secretion system protein ImpK
MSFNANTNQGYGSYATAQSNIAINYLVNAADPIFSIAIKLKAIESLLDCNELKNQLIQEIRTFTKIATSYKKYDSSIIKNACYILADFIDDTVAATAWGKDNNWENQTLLSAFPEIAKEPGFFGILKSAAENPFSNLDLLEMAYLCLTLGYEGKYRNNDQGSNILAVAKSDLYKYLAKHRHGENNSLLISDPDAELPPTIVERKIKKLPLSALIAIIFAIVIVGLLHFGFNSKLNNSLKPIVKMTQNINLIPDTLNG